MNWFQYPVAIGHERWDTPPRTLDRLNNTAWAKQHRGAITGFMPCCGCWNILPNGTFVGEEACAFLLFRLSFLVALSRACLGKASFKIVSTIETQKQCRFLSSASGMCLGLRTRCTQYPDGTPHACDPRMQGKKTALFEPFIYKMYYFTKTGSGRT